MLILHSGRVIMPMKNTVFNGGSMRKAEMVSQAVPNSPIFGITHGPIVEANNGTVLGSSITGIKFNKDKKVKNIRFIL